MNPTHSRRSLHALALAVAASLAMIVVSSPAGAAPDRNRHRGHQHDDRGRSKLVIKANVQHRSVSCSPVPVRHQHSHVVVHSSSCRCNSCFASHDYARGFNRGEAAGTNAGYRDGLSGMRYCPEIRDDLRCVSKAYRDGYLASFSNAYRCAYERGAAERVRACRPAIAISFRW